MRFAGNQRPAQHTGPRAPRAHGAAAIAVTDRIAAAMIVGMPTADEERAARAARIAAAQAAKTR